MNYLVIARIADYFGIQPWDTYSLAKIYADSMRSQGFECDIILGQVINEELRDKQEAAMAELTTLDQEMGLYDTNEENPLIRRN